MRLGAPLVRTSYIYICVRPRACFSSVGPLVRVGETLCFRRRLREHFRRILNPEGGSQLPFYQFLRKGSTDPYSIGVLLSEWLFIPIRYAPACARLRRDLERRMVLDVGTLNPPKIYFLLRQQLGCRHSRLAPRLARKHRPFLRIRMRTKVKGAVASTCSKLGPSRRCDLQMIAAAVLGYSFFQSGVLVRAVWNLTPRAYVYIARRVGACDQPWRRARGLSILRRVATKRRDLLPPIARLQASAIWMGTKRSAIIVRHSFCNLLQQWRDAGYWLPVLRHARFAFSTTRTPSVRDKLVNTDTFCTYLNNNSVPQCRCSDLLSRNMSWPTVFFEGERHIAAPQRLIPWPAEIKHLGFWPASIALPPTFDDLLSSLRKPFGNLRDRCRIRDDG